MQTIHKRKTMFFVAVICAAFLAFAGMAGGMFGGGTSPFSGEVITAEAAGGTIDLKTTDLYNPIYAKNSLGADINNIQGNGTTAVNGSFTLKSGKLYKFEVWGASGGTATGGIGGVGGYSVGWYDMRGKAETTASYYVGGMGQGNTAGGGGFNGGGNGARCTDGSYTGGGGGATDIRLSAAIADRIIVAGGGGSLGFFNGGLGGNGGGASGGGGGTAVTGSGSGVGGGGGTQSGGGSAGTPGVNGAAGGTGGNSTTGTGGNGGAGAYAGGGAGGGGYCGGGGGGSTGTVGLGSGGGGGGSGYVGGVDSLSDSAGAAKTLASGTAGFIASGTTQGKITVTEYELAGYLVYMGTGATFTAKKVIGGSLTDIAPASNNVAIQTVINNIKTDSGGYVNSLTFDGKSADFDLANIGTTAYSGTDLNIGGDGMAFDGFSGVNIYGRLTSSTLSPTISVGSGGVTTNITSNAYITNSAGGHIFSNTSGGSLDIAFGDVTSLGDAVFNSGAVSVSGGATVTASGWNTISSNGDVTVSGGAVITGNDGTAITGANVTVSDATVSDVWGGIQSSGNVTISAGAVITASKGTAITGGAVTVTGGAVSGATYAVYTDPSGSVVLGGTPAISGALYAAVGKISVLTTGADIFAPGANIYWIELSNAAINQIAVTNGSAFLANFKLITDNFSFEKAYGLQVGVAPNAAHLTLKAEYHIKTAEELALFRDKVNAGTYDGRDVFLDNDIDLTDWLNANGGTAGWVPIGTSARPFTGMFDGQGYKITGLWINRLSESFIGFFGLGQGCTIQNIGIVINPGNAIRGGSCTGGLIGWILGTASSNTFISDCYVRGSIEAAHLSGGFIGRIDNSTAGSAITITKSGFIGTFRAPYSNIAVGGFLGTVAGTSLTIISDCYSRGVLNAGTAAATNMFAGGFNGTADTNNGGQFSNCYSAMVLNVTGTGTIGAFSGLTPASLTASFYDKDLTSSVTTHAGVTPAATAQMKTQSTFDNPTANWNFTSAWTMGRSGYPIIQGHPEDEIIITTAEELAAFRDSVNNGTYYGSNVYLANDIDLTDWLKANGGATGWEPIGSVSSGYLFEGYFDGQGYKIKGLWIDDRNEYNLGLFGMVSGCTIINLGLQLDERGITASGNSGGFIAIANTSAGSVTISNCYIVGTVNILGGANSGGFIGIINSGHTGGTITIEKCGFLGVLNTSVSQNAGGFVGYINNSNPAYISDCYARGTVNAGAGTQYVGGFFGNSTASTGVGSISRCYASVTVKGGAASLGAFGGNRGNTGLTFSDCFYDSGVTALLAVSGADMSGITGTSTANIKTQSTFTGAGWNFTAVWEMGALSGYPIIQGHLDVVLIIEITPDDLLPDGKLKIGSIGGLTYNGSAQTPTPSVTYDGTLLTAGTDFDFDYDNNINAGTNAKLIITFKGDYEGTVEILFTIEKAVLYVTANDVSLIYGSAFANTGVAYSGFVNGETAADLGGTLAFDTTYTTTTNAGTAGITLTPKGLTSDNYTITFVPGTVTIGRANGSVNVTMAGWTYGGTAATPSIINQIGDSVFSHYEYSRSADFGTLISAPASTSEAGIYYVRAVFTDGTNYRGFTTAGTSFVITAAADNEITWITFPADITYGQALTAASAASKYGTVTYFYESTDGAGYSSAQAPANAGAYKVTASVAGTADYNAASGFKNFLITQADPDDPDYGDPDYEVPALSPITYDPNRTLADIVLPNGWAWDDDSITPTVGNSGYSATYTPTDSNYASKTITVTLMVNPLLLTKPTPSGSTSLTYTGAEQTLGITGYDSATMNITGNTGTIVNSYTAIITLKDTTNYGWTGGGSVEISWSIGKTDPSDPDYGDPNYEVPALSPITYAPNRTLADIVLPNGWAWDDDSATPTVGNSGYSATYTPTDSNYASKTITVALTVNPLLLTKPTASGSTSLGYTGAEQTLSITGYDSATMNITGNTGTIVNSYTAIITLKDTTNYGWIGGGSVTINWSITQADPDDPDYGDPNYEVPDLSAITYDPNRTLADIVLPNGWAWDDDSITPTVGNSGYSATYTPTDNNYSSKTVTLTLTVNPLLLTKPTASGSTSLTYTGAEQTLGITGFDSATMNITGNTGTIANSYTAVITLKDTVNYGWIGGGSVTINWSITQADPDDPDYGDPNYEMPDLSAITYDPNRTLADIVLPSGWAWDDDSITPTVDNSGYSATYTPTDKNYSSKTVTLTLTVNPLLLTKPTASGSTSLTYTGAEQTLGITGFDSATMNISGNTGTTVKSYTAVITLKDTVNYGWTGGGSVSISWEIYSAAIEGITVSGGTYTYDNTAKTVSITGPLDGISVTYSLTGAEGSFTQTHPEVKNAGTYTVYVRITKAGYETLNTSAVIVINRATAGSGQPGVTAPTTPDTHVYGTTLDQWTLSDPAWAWTIGSLITPTVVNDGYEVWILVDDVNYDYDGVEGYDDVTHIVKKTIAVTVTKSTDFEGGGIAWTITQPTAEGSHNYGTELGGWSISDPNWSWLTADLIPTLVNNGYEAKIDVSAYDSNYDYTGIEGYDEATHTVTRTLAVTVTQSADLPAGTVTTPTAAGSYKYGTTLNNWALSNTDWAWVDGTIIPTVVNSGYYVVIAVDDVSYDYTGVAGYDPLTHTVTRLVAIVTVTKSTDLPSGTVTTPTTSSSHVYGTALNNWILSDTNWAWVNGGAVPAVNNTGYNAVISVDDVNCDYSGVQGYDPSTHTVTRLVAVVTVTKSTTFSAGTVTTPTTSSSFVYGTALGNWVLSDTSWAWVNGSAVPTVINGGYSAAVSVDDINYDYSGVPGYDPATHTVTRLVSIVNVVKANPAYTAPTPGAVTYDPAKTLGGITLPAGWAWDNAATVPIVKNSGYSATFTPVDTDNYNTIMITVQLTVNKADPEYTIPVLSAVTYSPAKTLGGITLPAGWAWGNANTVPVVKNSGYSATFTPQDTDNYNTVAATIALTVNKAPASDIPKELTETPNPGGNDYGSKLEDWKLPDGWEWKDGSIVPGYDDDSFDAVIDVSDWDENYDFSGIEGYDPDTHKIERSVPIEVNIPKAQLNAFFWLVLAVMLVILTELIILCLLIKKKNRRDGKAMREYLDSHKNDNKGGGK